MYFKFMFMCIEIYMKWKSYLGTWKTEKSVTCLSSALKSAIMEFLCTCKQRMPVVELVPDNATAWKTHLGEKPMKSLSVFSSSSLCPKVKFYRQSWTKGVEKNYFFCTKHHNFTMFFLLSVKRQLILQKRRILVLPLPHSLDQCWYFAHQLMG